MPIPVRAGAKADHNRGSNPFGVVHLRERYVPIQCCTEGLSERTGGAFTSRCGGAPAASLVADLLDDAIEVDHGVDDRTQDRQELQLLSRSA